MVNACRLLSNEPLLPVPSARLLAEQSASELKAKVEGTHAIGYYYSAGTGPKQAAATRAKTASKMPLPPQAPKVLNTSAPQRVAFGAETGFASAFTEAQDFARASYPSYAAFEAEGARAGLAFQATQELDFFDRETFKEMWCGNARKKCAVAVVAACSLSLRANRCLLFS